MVNLIVLTEEKSQLPVVKAAFEKAGLAAFANLKVVPHSGKQDLQRAIPKIVPTYSRLPNAAILVLQDQDSNNCINLKAEIAGLLLQHANTCPYKVRIACTELESWYFGDWAALKAAFPRFNPDRISRKAQYRNPDAIVNPAQELLKIIPELVGATYLAKYNTAEKLAPLMDIVKNESSSFRHFVQALEALAKQEATE
jgi:hypothetical protein